MRGKAMTNKGVFFLLLLAGGVCLGEGCAGGNSYSNSVAESEAGRLERVLEALKESTGKLETYTCLIEYKVAQPLFESETLRKGDLYFAKGEKRPVLRINFQTLKQDDEKEQKYPDHYIFDGAWLTHIDYRLKEIKRHRMLDVNEPNETVDVFEQVSRNFPLLGFSKPENLKKDFEITLVEDTGEDNLIQLHLKARPGSGYSDGYTSLDFWLDKAEYLPVKIVALSTEDDIYEVRLLKAKVNKRLGEKVFEIEVPEDFSGPEIVPLGEKDKSRKPVGGG
jgi:outer membrane lipoprotein-sorting protein